MGYGFSASKYVSLTFNGEQFDVFLDKDQIPTIDCSVHMGVGLHKYGSQDARAYAEERITRVVLLHAEHSKDRRSNQPCDGLKAIL